jgi:hypothetical protein
LVGIEIVPEDCVGAALFVNARKVKGVVVAPLDIANLAEVVEHAERFFVHRHTGTNFDRKARTGTEMPEDDAVLLVGIFLHEKHGLLIRGDLHGHDEMEILVQHGIFVLVQNNFFLARPRKSFSTTAVVYGEIIPGLLSHVVFVRADALGDCSIFLGQAAT